MIMDQLNSKTSVQCISTFNFTSINVDLSLQQPMIIDPDSNGETILEFVSELLSKLDQLQEKAIIYKNYQKNFKVRKLCYIHQS